MMGTLFSKITTFSNLLLVATRASKRKRTRSNVAVFSLSLEEELYRLQDELCSQTYRPGPYRTFMIHDKKPRLISAASFRDRVVHHALCNVVEPIFDRGFLDASYACRKGKGPHAAIERASAFARRYRFVLKCDIAQYFPSIDHEILLAAIRRRIWDDEVLWLIQSILASNQGPSSALSYFPGDDLFTPMARARGLPIGNQTSQFFANVYLNELDHLVKEQWGAPGYVRYVDDFLVFHQEKSVLHGMLKSIQAQCEEWRLHVHPRKCFVGPVKAGFTFLGHRVFPTHRRLEARNVRQFRRRLRVLNHQVKTGGIAIEVGRHRVQSWVAHAEQANTVRLRIRLFQEMAWV